MLTRTAVTCDLRKKTEYGVDVTKKQYHMVDLPKLDSSDNEEDNTSFGNDPEDDSSLMNKGAIHYPKPRNIHPAVSCSGNPNNSFHQQHVFDCQECRFQAASYEQYQDHLRKTNCGPQQHYVPPGGSNHHLPSNNFQMAAHRKRSGHEPLFHQQYNYRPPQNLYMNHYNGGSMFSQYSPRQRWYLPPPPHPDFVRGWHPMRYPSYTWASNEYTHPPHVYPHSNCGSYAPPVHPPSSKHVQPPPYFYKSPEQQYPSSKRICKVNNHDVPYSSSPGIHVSQAADSNSLGPDLDEAIASIQNEEDEGSNRLVQEVVAFVDGKKQKVGNRGENVMEGNMVENSIGHRTTLSQIVDDNAYLKDCSRDPVLTATSGFVIPVTVTADSGKINGSFEDIVNNESLILNGNLSSDATTETIFEEENLRLIFENNFETQLCPHKSVLQLPSIPASEQARDQLKLVTLQAQLGYILTGLLGYSKLNVEYDYSRSSVHQILHKILAQSNIKPVEENYLCNAECNSIVSSLDKKELFLRIIKLRLHVIRANIGKLLCVCVPHRNEWKKFHWDGLTIDEILDNLTQEDIPLNHEEIEAEVINEPTKEDESGETTGYLMEINEGSAILQTLENGGEIEIPSVDEEFQK
ncbi:uncharacterized protein [Lepeophtheirus salmonis]|uniref:uncharacterized protein isoform X2 n=1 Tax=Lepeophtheirus salmonis TaxID=72036 RepID=UPI003AF3FFBA